MKKVMLRVSAILVILTMVLGLIVGCAGAATTTAATTAATTKAASSTTAATTAATTAKLNYPTKPIEIYVPYAAGGGQDVFSRLTAKHMLKYLPSGANVVVTNKTGGGGVVGATAIAQAKPDGYTLGALVPYQLTDQFILEQIPYTEKSFVPLAVGSFDCNYLVVSTKLNVKNLKEFVDYCKANPGKVTIGMGGNWNVHDFFRVKLEKALGVKFSRMTFNGGADALTATMGGNCDSASNSISEALSAIESKKVVPVAVSTPTRTTLTPDVPTLKELGFDVVHGQWRAITCPPGTPVEIQNYLQDVLKKVFSDPEWIADAKKAGFDPVNYVGKDAVDYVNKDFEVYKGIIKELGLAPGKANP